MEGRRAMRVAFVGPLAICSNFAGRGMRFRDLWFRSREHAFQWGKFPHLPEVQAAIRNAPSASHAKLIAKGYKASVRKDWHDVNIAYMEEVVLCYFEQWEDHRNQLLRTGDIPLEEENTWGDTFWGTVAGKGLNHLGEILMRVRSRLRAKYGPQ